MQVVAPVVGEAVQVDPNAPTDVSDGNLAVQVDLDVAADAPDEKSSNDAGENQVDGARVSGKGRELCNKSCFTTSIVRCPCLMATIIMALCLVCVISTFGVLASEGAEVFNQDEIGDLHDLRTNQWDALQAAQAASRGFGAIQDGAQECEEWGVKRVCRTDVTPQQTDGSNVVLIVWAAKKEGQLFTESNLRQMRTVEDKMLLDKNFTDFCLRWDKKGKDKACEQPMSVLNLFYATGVNTSQAVQHFDSLDGNTDGKLDIFSTPGLSEAMAGIGAEFSKQRITKDNATQALSFFGALNQKYMATGTPAEKAAMQMFPMMSAFLGSGNERGDELQDVGATLKLCAYMKTVGFLSPVVDYYFDKSFSVASMSGTYSRGAIVFGVPLFGYKNKDDRFDEQEKTLVTWFEDSFSEYLKDTKEAGDVEVLFFATPLILGEFLNIIVGDITKVFISMTFVFLWLWCQTKSIFIATVGMTEIVLSVPIAFFFYRQVFGFTFFDPLNAMTLFIVMAIGADDIFVFMDAYFQSAYRHDLCIDLQTRMSWVYNRAATAMFITSLTTCAAFVCSSTSPLISIKSFGIFSAFVIAADYVLVITWFPACVVLYHNYIENRPCCLWCCGCGRMFPCTFKMERTTDQVWAKGLQPIAGAGHKRWSVTVDQTYVQKRFLERFFSGPFAHFLSGPIAGFGGLLKKGFAPYVIVFGVLLVIPFSWLAASIKPISRSEEGLPSDHPFQRVWTISGTEFPSSASTPNTAVYVVWGVEDMDREGVNLLVDVKNRGKLVWDNTFSFDEAAQKHILNVCRQVQQMQPPSLEAFLSRDPDSPLKEGYVKCPLEEWKSWLEQPGRPGFPLPLAQVKVQMPLFLKTTVKSAFGQNITVEEKWKGMIGYDPAHNGGAVRMMQITVRSQLAQRSSMTASRLEDAYNDFEAWMQDVNTNDRGTPGQATPVGANKAYHASDGDFNGPNWMWMHTQGVFVSSAFFGAGMGVAMAFLVILVFTKQIIIAFSALVTISCVLMSVLAMMKLAGYELGTITSVAISILAGFAVDFVVHLAHAFAASSKPTREGRFHDTFEVIAVSVFSGALTSVLAASVLLLCTLQFFAKFGFFLIFTVIWAWIWGNFFFMSVMYLIGPDDATPWWLRLPASIVDPALSKARNSIILPVADATQK